MSTSQRIIRTIQNTYFGYLAILPSAATWIVFHRTHGLINPDLFLVWFIPGIAAIAIALAIITSYTSMPRSWWGNLYILLDTLVFSVVIGFLHHSLEVMVMSTVIVEYTGIFIALLIVSLTSSLPTRSQRWQSVGIALGIIAIGVWIVWRYQQVVPFSGVQWIVMLAGAVQSTLVQVRMLSTDNVQRDATGAVLISVLLFMVVGIASSATSN